MDKFLIITSHIEYMDDIRLDIDSFDFIIAVDGGVNYCDKLKVAPNIIIGDFDSIKNLNFTNTKCKDIIHLNTEKDFTDTDAAIDFAIQKGCDDITVLGGLGGRFDHSMANLTVLAKYIDTPYNCSIKIFDGKNLVYMLNPGDYTLSSYHFKYFSLISYTPVCAGITLKGVKYPLHNFSLSYSTTLGVSNEIIATKAELSFSEGKLLIVHSND